MFKDLPWPKKHLKAPQSVLPVRRCGSKLFMLPSPQNMAHQLETKVKVSFTAKSTNIMAIQQEVPRKNTKKLIQFSTCLCLKISAGIPDLERIKKGIASSEKSVGVGCCQSRGVVSNKSSWMGGIFCKDLLLDIFSHRNKHIMPIGSMGLLNENHKNQPNIGKYTIHGCGPMGCVSFNLVYHPLESYIIPYPPSVCYNSFLPPGVWGQCLHQGILSDLDCCKRPSNVG